MKIFAPVGRKKANKTTAKILTIFTAYYRLF